MIEKIVDDLKNKHNVLGIVDCDGINNYDLLHQTINHYKPKYDYNDRIVYVCTKHTNHLLSNIQTIIDTIDISSFFVVVVAPNQIIKNNLTDITFIGCASLNEETDTLPSLSKSDVLEMRNDHLLTDKEKSLLFSSKHFCLAPWIHTHIETDGVCKLCCFSTKKLGTTDTHTLSELTNSSTVNEIKKDMLEDKPISGCECCYTEESLGKTSYRNNFNQKFSHHISKINDTKFELVSWDFRFNNLCNLSCRSCNENASSSWAKPAEYLGIKLKDRKKIINDGVYEQLIKHIDVVEEIYFAGGEPLIMKEHYDLLELLILKNKTDVRLIYNTNFTKTNYKNIDVFDLWNKFSNVAVCASLDAEGDRAEYLRCGTKWNDILENRKKMLVKSPHIYFWVSATTGLINALHIPDLHKKLYDIGFIDDLSDFNIQNIYFPEFMRVDTAPIELKAKILKKYKQHINWLKTRDKSGRATSGFEGVLELLTSNKKFDSELFWSNIDPLDVYYKKEIRDYFPELQDIYKQN